jgi:hypothetical protein
VGCPESSRLRVRLGIKRLRCLGRDLVGGEGAVAQSWSIQCSSRADPIQGGRSIRPDFNHFPSLVKSPVGNGSLQLDKIAEASERINGNQHVLDERPSPDFFDRYEKFVSQRHQQ